ncbi:hypothetical protein [Micromonospora sp. NPDC047730]|uniref:hypothetical protein n=1 Tax=Micromonospora sp. NPDC047730 TaxID=3364253 RepID=UPI003721806D
MRANPRQIGLAVAVAVVLAVIVGILLVDSPPDQQPAGGPAATTAPASEQPTSAPATSAPASTRPAELTDGIYTVGTEVAAGTYVTTAGDHPCYWARLRSFGRSDSIIEDDNLEPGESATVRVQSTDKGFKVSNGCRWRAQVAL